MSYALLRCWCYDATTRHCLLCLRHYYATFRWRWRWAIVERHYWWARCWNMRDAATIRRLSATMMHTAATAPYAEDDERDERVVYADAERQRRQRWNTMSFTRRWCWWATWLCRRWNICVYCANIAADIVTNMLLSFVASAERAARCDDAYADADDAATLREQHANIRCARDSQTRLLLRDDESDDAYVYWCLRRARRVDARRHFAMITRWCDTPPQKILSDI